VGGVFSEDPLEEEIPSIVDKESLRVFTELTRENKVQKI
jgi:hypothetical protein